MLHYILSVAYRVRRRNLIILNTCASNMFTQPPTSPSHSLAHSLDIHTCSSSYTGNNKINWIECVWTWLTPWGSLKIIVKFYKLMSLFSFYTLSPLLPYTRKYSHRMRHSRRYDMYVYFSGDMKAWMARALQNLWISKKHLPQKPIERER